MAADQTVKEWQSFSVSVPVKATINDIIVLSDSDEEDVNIEVTSAGRKEVESPDINIWHCSGICGSGTRRPVSLSALKRWSESEFDSSYSHLEFKVYVPVKATINDIIVLSDNDEEDVNIEVTSAGRNEVEKCRNQSANMAADQTVNDWQSVSVYVPVKVTINDIIVLSDSDEEDVNIEVTSAGRKEVESPDINIWHCSGICGSGTRRPVSLSALKRWSESEFDSSYSHLEFKVSVPVKATINDIIVLSDNDEEDVNIEVTSAGRNEVESPDINIFRCSVIYECRNQSANMAADQTVNDWQSVSVYVPVKVTINDIIVLSDSDEEDVNIEVTSAGRKEVESPDINIWHCSGESEREEMSLRDALKLRQDDPMPTLLEESNSDCQTLNPANCGLPQPSNIISDADVECRNQSANMAADQTVKEWQNVSVSVPVKTTINDIIVLSDSDEEDVNIEVTSAGRNEVESPDINIFHCSVIYGSGTRRPVSLSALKR
ncbi:unnamed protein product [Trifolium pratense]|uniref:Uncharacterized protein n=1 Tax=Trifolium pratense TaxID=57577 RepID=A0ACB0L0V8_TRIPR|nr:unnamed protein product [Trifolium pratense]